LKPTITDTPIFTFQSSNREGNRRLQPCHTMTVFIRSLLPFISIIFSISSSFWFKVRGTYTTANTLTTILRLASLQPTRCSLAAIKSADGTRAVRRGDATEGGACKTISLLPSFNQLSFHSEDSKREGVEELPHPQSFSSALQSPVLRARA
jgi:hypothetical protein